MNIHIQYPKEVYDANSTEIQIYGTNLQGNVKVFINGEMYLAPVKDGKFEMRYQAPLEQGNNTFQIDVASKGAYCKEIVEIHNYATLQLTVDREDVPSGQTMIPCDLLKKLKFNIEKLPSLALRIYDEDVSIIVKEGIKEININGETILTDHSPLLINNQLHIPASMIIKIPDIMSLITPDKITFTRIR